MAKEEERLSRILLGGSAETFDVVLQFFVELNISPGCRRADLRGTQPVSAAQVGILQVGAAQIGSPENTSLQISRVQVGLAKFGFHQQSIVEFCALQPGSGSFRGP